MRRGDVIVGGEIRVAQVNNGKNVIVAHDDDYLFLCCHDVYMTKIGRNMQ